MCNMEALSQSVQKLMPRLSFLWTDRQGDSYLPQTSFAGGGGGRAVNNIYICKRNADFIWHSVQKQSNRNQFDTLYCRVLIFLQEF